MTGGAGFIGSNLVRGLLEKGARVTVLDTFATGRPENLPASGRLAVVTADLASFDGLDPLLRGVDFVFHLAAQVGNVKSLEATVSDATVNVLGSIRLFEACRRATPRKIVYSSSSAIFGEAERVPIDEDHPQRPASFYALSKLTAERYAVLSASLWQIPVVSLRYFNVFGLPMENNEYTGVISIFLKRLQTRQPLIIYGDGEQFRDFVYVRDVVRANLLAAWSGTPGRVYNIGTGRATTVRDLARTIGKLTGRSPEILFRDFRPAEVRRSVADISRARAELGFEPQYDLTSGLSEMWSALSIAT
ncbi:MAG: NAD-dependent epimerase/dehydratase family protein [Thermoanaerobaculia bacterium]